MFFCSSLVLGQNTAELNVYFDIDQHELSAIELEQIKIFVTNLPLDSINKVELFGHTDSRRDQAHNQILSENRVQAVQSVLITLGINKSSIYTVAFGESKPKQSNDTDLGRQQNRRTEIVVHYQNAAPPVVVETNTIQEITPIIEDELIDCNKDTILVMPSGSLVELALCDYINIKDCFSFQEFLHPDSARAAGLTTMSSDGIPLFSGGMFTVTNCAPSICTKIWIPLLVGGESPCSDVPCAMSLWQINKSNSWNSLGGPLSIVKIDGKEYYEIEVCGSNTYNIDCKPPKIKKFISRVKVKRGYKLLNAKISYSSPFIIAQGTRKEAINPNNRWKPKRKLKFTFDRNHCPLCNKAELYAKAIAPNGDTLIRTFTLAAPYRKRTAFGICKGEVVKKFLFFFKIKEKAIYKKYILKRKDFDVCLPYHKLEEKKVL